MFERVKGKMERRAKKRKYYNKRIFLFGIAIGLASGVLLCKLSEMVCIGDTGFEIMKNNEWQVEGMQKNLQGEEDINVDAIADKLVNPDFLRLVNCWNPLEEGFVPVLEEIENGYEVDSRIVKDLEQMLEDGRDEGMDFWICSAYRSVDRQKELFDENVRKYLNQGMGRTKAEQEAQKEVQRPGESEHSTGLAVDIVARSYQILDEKQEDTSEAEWLHKNSYKYGFVLRYPVDKSDVTGIIYEPWHYRYVGKKAAKDIYNAGITLEEYLEKYN